MRIMFVAVFLASVVFFNSIEQSSQSEENNSGAENPSLNAPLYLRSYPRSPSELRPGPPGPSSSRLESPRSSGQSGSVSSESARTPVNQGIPPINEPPPLRRHDARRSRNNNFGETSNNLRRQLSYGSPPRRPYLSPQLVLDFPESSLSPSVVSNQSQASSLSDGTSARRSPENSPHK